MDEPERYTVAAGDCIASIAFDRGMHPDTIWNHPENAELAARRTTGYVLEPGDVLYIPAKRVREEQRAIDQRHVFKRKGVPEKLVLQFLEDDEPRSGDAYELEIDFRPVAKGKLDDQGMLEVWIPPNAKHGKLLLDTDEEIRLELGRMNPRDDDEGLHDRLYNLGYFDGLCNQRELPDAVVAYQDHEKQDLTGEAAPDIRERLEKEHGS